MGLYKETEHTSGTIVRYWNISSFNYNKTHKFIDFDFTGYVNQDLSKHKCPLMKRKVRVIREKFDEYFSIKNMDTLKKNIIAIGYEYAKNEEDFFTDSEDVLEQEVI